MKSSNLNFRAVPCYNSTFYSQVISNNEVTYLLFEKPMRGYKLADICTPNCAKERICKYMMKDFTKGLLNSLCGSISNDDPLDVSFVLAQDGFYYGSTPPVTKDLKDPATKSNDKKPKDEVSDQLKYFNTIAFMKYHSPEEIKPNPAPPAPTPALKAIKTKQLISYVGAFLANLYKGLDETTNIPPPGPNDNFFAPYHFLNWTDTYLALNREKTGNYSKFQPDAYYGVTKTYINELNGFLEMTLTTQPAIAKMSADLGGSFYEFIYFIIKAI